MVRTVTVQVKAFDGLERAPVPERFAASPFADRRCRASRGGVHFCRSYRDLRPALLRLRPPPPLRLRPPPFRGTLPPARRASLRPMAIACLRLVTFLPERPDLS